MLFDEMTIEEIVAVRSEEAREEGREEGHSEGINLALKLLNQNLSIDEIKQRLTQTKTT